MTASLGPLRHAAFRYLVFGRTVTMLGNAVAPIALAFAVLDLTGSATDLGLVVGARSVTMVVFLLFGGVVADRLPRQRVMVASSVLAALTQAGVAAAVLTHAATVPSLAVLGAVNGVASAFSFPATGALIAQTVPAELRTAANSLNRLGGNTAMILGASAGGLLVASVGPGWGLAVDAVTFGLGAACYALVRVDDHRDATSEPSRVLADLRDGWGEFVGRTWVWVVVLGFLWFNLATAAGQGVVGPVLADQTFGRSAWGYILAANTAGMIVGALVAMRVRVRRLLRLGVLCCSGESLLLAALGLTPNMAVLVTVAFLAGMGAEQFGIAWEVSLQEHVPASLLARVYSYDALGSFLAIPIGQVLVGPIIGLVGPSVTLLIAAGIVAAAVVGMLLSRAVRTLAHSPSQVELEPAVVAAAAN